MVCPPLCNAIQWEWLEAGRGSLTGRCGVVALGSRIDAGVLAQAGTLQLDAGGAVKDGIKNRIPDCWITEHCELPLISNGWYPALPLPTLITRCLASSSNS